MPIAQPEPQPRFISENYRQFKKGDRFVTVILRQDPQVEQKNFRCTHCGHILFQYKSGVQLIFEGRVVEDDRYIDILCRAGGCNTMYRITNL